MSFGGKDTGGDAGRAIGAANQQGIDELKKQFRKAKKNVQPFIEAGQGALGDVVSGSGIEGFGEALRQIFAGGALDPLIDERREDAQRQLAAGGLTRSGTALETIADIPTQLGLDIEGLLFGRKQGLSTQGLGAGLDLGSLGLQSAGAIANLFSGSGQARASGIITDQQAQAGGIEQAGSIISTALPIIASFFSDPALKENVEEIGIFEVDDDSKNLILYEWDWIPEAKDTIVSAFPKYGFMADEVEEKYPQHISHYGGFKTINYLDLLEELELNNEAFMKFHAERLKACEAN